MVDMWKRLGYKSEVATAIGVEIGYSSLAQVNELKDIDDATNFVKNIRRWKDGTDGYKVSLRAERNTQKLLFFLKHMGRTSRSVTPDDVTMARLTALDLQYQVEEDHDSSTVATPTIDSTDWSKTLESIQDFLNLHRGHTGVPLGYVVREDLLVAASNTDLPRGQAGSKYTSDDQEMIARAPIVTAAAAGSGKSAAELEKEGPFSEAFMVDSKTAYNLLAPMFQDHPSFTYFREGRKTLNARLASLQYGITTWVRTWWITCRPSGRRNSPTPSI